jgi:hypothetical protein
MPWPVRRVSRAKPSIDVGMFLVSSEQRAKIQAQRKEAG